MRRLVNSSNWARILMETVHIQRGGEKRGRERIKKKCYAHIGAIIYTHV